MPAFPSGRDVAFVLSFEQARAAVGAFHVRWHHPTADQATIDRIEWDAPLGGSDEEVCQVINALAGWRLSR